VSGLLPVDLATLAYAAVALGVLLLRAHVPSERPLLVLAHLSLAVAALCAPRARRSGALGRFLGELYPLLALLPLYTAVGLINNAGGRSYDALVQSWEQGLFGSQVSLAWIRAWPWPWLSALLHAAYLSYYAIVAGAPLALLVSGRRDAARRVLAVEMATFYVCYALFLAFPVLGPRYLFPLADNPATRVGIARLTQRLLAAGSAWGTAFPSSHVAAALVAAWAAYRESRRLGALLLPAALLLAVGTVYCQLHYAVDALAGALLAAAMLLAWRR
jgi:membrane-associated phospholipid phosphatase